MKAKKILSFVVALVLLLTAAIPVQAATYSTFAVNGDNVITTAESVTISGIPEEAETITYTTYQVLYATYIASSNEFAYHLTDWAKAALVDSDKYDNEAAAIEAVSDLITTGGTSTEQTALVNILGDYIIANSGTDTWTADWQAGGTNSVSAELPVGAYLVIPSCSNMAFLNMLVSVDATAAGSNNKWETEAHDAVLKGNVVSIDKVVEETGANETADGSTDAQIGERVTYTITVDVPRFPNTSSGIVFNIVDTPENVAIDMNTVKVYAVVGTSEDELDKTDGDYTAVWDGTAGTLTIDLSAKYMSIFYNSVDETYPYTTVKVTYEAEVTSDALVNAANENTATLTYGHDSSTNTASASADVYTYKLKLTKENTENDPLSDASFEISLGGTAIAFVATGTDGVYRVADSDDTGSSVTVTTASDGTLTLIGLDADTEYMIKETVAPSGYSINSNVLYFTINAPSTLDGKVSSVTANEYTDSSKAAGTEVDTSSMTWSAGVESTDHTQVELSLTDTAIPALVSTGGVGIIIFTVIGVIIMAVAVFVMNSSKNKKTN